MEGLRKNRTDEKKKLAEHQLLPMVDGSALGSAGCHFECGSGTGNGPALWVGLGVRQTSSLRAIICFVVGRVVTVGERRSVPYRHRCNKTERQSAIHIQT